MDKNEIATIITVIFCFVAGTSMLCFFLYAVHQFFKGVTDIGIAVGRVALNKALLDWRMNLEKEIGHLKSSSPEIIPGDEWQHEDNGQQEQKRRWN